MPNETTSSVADSSTEHQTVQDQGEAPRKPAGSVELLYCEKCGGLILGGAKNAQPAPNGNGFYCKKCLAAAPAPVPPAPAVTKSDTAPSLPVAETKEVPKRRPSAAITSVVKRDSGNSRSKIMDLPSRSKRQNAQGKDGKDGGTDNTKLIAGGAAAAAVVLVLGVLMLGGGSKKETETAKSGTSTRSESPAPEPARAEPVRRGPSTLETPAPKVVLPARSEPYGRPTEPDPIEAARKLEQAERKTEPAVETPQARPEPQAEKAPTQAEPAKPADPKQVENAARASNPAPSKGAEEEEDLGKTKDAPKDPAKAPGNPFSVGEGGEDPTKVLPGQKPAQPPAAATATVPAKPKPLIVKGKASPIFPSDRDSKTVDHQSPAMQQGQKSGIPETKYDGWTFMGRKLDAWNVKSGMLTCDGQMALTLDGFPGKDFEFKFDVELVGGSGLGVMAGSAKEGILLLAVVPTHVLPGVWDQTKTGNNVMMDNKAAKPHGCKDAWISVRMLVQAGNADITVAGKPVFKGPLTHAVQFPQFGFLVLGMNNNPNPKLKIRNATVLVP